MDPTRAVAGPGRRAVLTTPTYGMIRRFSVLSGAEVIDVPWWGGDWPVDEVVSRAGNETALVAVVSPSNQTGAVVTREALKELDIRASDTTASVQGFGNVSQYAIELYNQIGGKVTAVSCAR